VVAPFPATFVSSVVADYERRANPIHVSLHEVRLIAGAPRQAAVLLWTVAACLLYAGVSAGAGPFALASIPVGMVAHKILALWTKNDPLRPKIYMRAYTREKNRYDPWPRAKTYSKSRPSGFGRGMLR